MDRYIVKTPRPPKEDPTKKTPPKQLRQTTIESLQGVVVVEEVLRLKSVLRVQDQTTEKILDALKKLDQKIPSRDVLKSTKIGHTINKLTKHSEKEVRLLATQIVKRWKRHFEDKLDKPMIEVRCDLQTEKLRKAGRKLLAGAMGVMEKDNLVEAIEREAFHQHKRLIHKDYRRTVRTLVFTLKHQDDVRNKLSHPPVYFICS